MLSRVLFGLVAAAVLAGILWTYLAPQPPLAWQGYAEADYVKVAPTTAGLVTALHVDRGSSVSAGAALFDQDDVDEQAALDQARGTEAQAEAELQDLELPARPEEITTARANLADALAAAGKIRTDLRRDEALAPKGFATRQLVDQERADLRSAEAKQAAMVSTLAQQENSSGRVAAITAQKHAVAVAHAVAEQAAWRLAQRHVTAPASGMIADVLVRPGEMIDAGTAVVSLLPPKNIFVRFFVGEQVLARVHLGARVRLVCDSCASDLTGTISFIAPEAEYTPPVIYSDESRDKLVTMVEARPPPAQATRLNPGEPVQVYPQ